MIIFSSKFLVKPLSWLNKNYLGYKEIDSYIVCEIAREKIDTAYMRASKGLDKIFILNISESQITVIWLNPFSIRFHKRQLE